MTAIEVHSTLVWNPPPPPEADEQNRLSGGEDCAFSGIRFLARRVFDSSDELTTLQRKVNELYILFRMATVFLEPPRREFAVRFTRAELSSWALTQTLALLEKEDPERSFEIVINSFKASQDSNLLQHLEAKISSHNADFRALHRAFVDSRSLSLEGLVKERFVPYWEKTNQPNIDLLVEKTVKSLTASYSSNIATQYMAHQCGLQIGSWLPDQSIDRLCSELEQYPLFISGHFGRPYYESPPQKIYTIRDHDVFGWTEGAKRRESKNSHVLILIGADCKNKQVYYFDSNDATKKSPTVYMMPFELLVSECNNLISIYCPEKDIMRQFGCVQYLPKSRQSKSCPELFLELIQSAIETITTLRDSTG